jgi:predicted RNA-binding protein with PUA-like domain
LAYWLIKSEPDVWSFEMQMKKGAKGEPWTGVRNFTARANLARMKKGHKAFFYHSNVGKEIVGVAEVVKENYPDPTAKKGEPWIVVDFRGVEALPKPITLETIKKEPKLKDMALVKYSRLSVQPVTAAEWKLVCAMGGLKGV